MQSLCRNTLAIPQNVNVKFPYDLAILLIDEHPREIKTNSNKNLYVNVHSSITKWLKGVKKPDTYQLMNRQKMWYIHTMKYHSFIKKNEVLIPTTTWMDLESFC